MDEKMRLDLVRLLLGESGRAEDCPFKVGDKVFIRTVTHHQTGRITAIRGAFLTLADAAWIPSDGRFTQAINDGVLDEVEPVDGPVHVNMLSIIDSFEWRHDLPRKQK